MFQLLCNYFLHSQSKFGKVNISFPNYHCQKLIPFNSGSKPTELYSFDVNWKWRLLVNEIWNHPQTVSSQYVPTKVFILNIYTFLYIAFNFNLLSPEIIGCVWSIVVLIQTWSCNLCMESILAFHFMVSIIFISVNIKKDLVFFLIRF